MSTIDTSIQRPYFRKQEYPRVVDTGFNELTQTVSDTQVEDLINEYRRLANSLPPEIHADIVRNSGAALGIDTDEENFDEINRLNILLDELESQDIQEQTIDSSEHPTYRNGSFILGLSFDFKENDNPNDIYDLSESDLKIVASYYYMQQGHRRRIQDKDLFEILYVSRNKNSDFNSIPICDKTTLNQIPLAAKNIGYNIGNETTLTDIFNVPKFVRPSVEQKYKDKNQVIPETFVAIQQSYIDLENQYKDDPEKQEILDRIVNPP